MIFCAKHKINLFRTVSRFLLCKKVLPLQKITMKQ